ncbi:hypothetical protein ILYODFUR_023302 [Ilyodon furcidens]|uniref:Uncharacterized protein n=2 Tax=Goodeidae TaxID=28758 RepID=A0ABV0UXT6_9TELE
MAVPPHKNVNELNLFNSIRICSFLLGTSHNKKGKQHKQSNLHKTRAFPHMHFVSPAKTKVTQPNACAAIVRRQLKPSVTQQGGGGESEGFPSKMSEGEWKKKHRRT